MIDHDKRQFKAMMHAMTTLYGKREYDADLLRIWYAKLKRFDIDMVSKSLDKWVDTHKHMPTPFEIIDLCKAQEVKVFDVALPPPTHTPEQIKDNQDRLNRELAKIKPKTDHKKWAKDILKEAKAGHYKFELGVKFANQALGK